MSDSWDVSPGPALPTAVANNAVAAATVNGRPWLFSFLGLESGRDFRAITTRAFALDVGGGRWERLPAVPGRVGRLAATAQSLGERVYVFGGYEVAADGTETTSPATDIYVASERRYARGADQPVPLDDTVSGVWRDRLIFLVSGWSTDRTVWTVQAYDPTADRWIAATPIPGTPVFGHAGGLVNDTMVYCGGAKMLGAVTPKYGISGECFRGDVDPDHPASITWRAIAAHPGPPRYRAAAGPVRTAAQAGIMFVGGTANPYNYNGIGYDGRPAEPEAATWIYDVTTDTWRDGVDERGLEAELEAFYMRGGAARLPFASIIKSGPNSLWPWRILATHNDRRNRAMKNGELVIFDVGCELDGYVSDTGRTLPVSGRFTADQRAILEMEVHISDVIIAAMRPGVTLGDVQRVAELAIPENARPFMQTGSFFGHHLGLSSGDPSVDDVALAPGMVITVEPWYYNHRRGISVFTEDVILITADGHENLTGHVARTPSGLEQLMRGRPG